jgi:hypothetical protein
MKKFIDRLLEDYGNFKDFAEEDFEAAADDYPILADINRGSVEWLTKKEVYQKVSDMFTPPRIAEEALAFDNDE